MFDLGWKNKGGQFCLEQTALEKYSLICKSVYEKNNKREKDPAGNKMKLFFITVKENLDEFSFANKLKFDSAAEPLAGAGCGNCSSIFFSNLGNKKALHASGSLVMQSLSYLHTYSAGIYGRAAGSSLNPILLLCSGCLLIRSVSLSLACPGTAAKASVKTPGFPVN